MNPRDQPFTQKLWQRYTTWASGNSSIKLGSEALSLHFLDLSQNNNASPTTQNKKEDC